MIEYGTFKHKLLSTMVMAGEYPYKSLDLMVESSIRKREVINLLKDKGYIDIKTVYGIKRIRFKMFDKKKAEYCYDLFEGADTYKPNEKVRVSERKLERIDRIAEVLIMMMEAGINVTDDEKPLIEKMEIIEETDERLPYFMTSLEARAAVEIKEDKGKGSRFHGTLVSCGGLYNIYNMGDSMMEWVRPSEYTAVDFNMQYQTKVLPWGALYKEWYGKSAIILSRSMEYLVDFVKGNVTPRHGHGTSKNLVNINNYYDHTFYLPLSYQGQIMLNMMCMKNWHYYLVGLFYKKEHLASKEVKMSIACDAVKDGYYSLVFMDGDIGRLKRFVNQEIKPENHGQFRILCYDFQEEVVKKLAPKGMDVVAYNFEKITNGFYNVYEQFNSSTQVSEE